MVTDFSEESSARRFVNARLSSADPSHDHGHVSRVVALARRIAKTLPEGSVDLLVVSLAAWFHDLTDAKYLPSGSGPVSAETSLRPWFDANADLRIRQSQRDLICRIVDNISYSKEVKRVEQGEETEWHRLCLELHCVQDADKLDALGAIGIMRCSAYSVVIDRPLVPLGCSDFGFAVRQCALGHFDEKLFKLKDMMKTAEGRRLAEKRDEFTRAFASQCKAEWEEAL